MLLTGVGSGVGSAVGACDTRMSEASITSLVTKHTRAHTSQSQNVSGAMQ